MSIRSTVHKVGGRILELLLNADGGDYCGRTLDCAHGHAYKFVEYRDKVILTVVGPVSVRRAYYFDKECGIGY
jgi:hypothetical protein